MDGGRRSCSRGRPSLPSVKPSRRREGPSLGRTHDTPGVPVLTVDSDSSRRLSLFHVEHASCSPTPRSIRRPSIWLPEMKAGDPRVHSGQVRFLGCDNHRGEHPTTSPKGAPSCWQGDFSARPAFHVNVPLGPHTNRPPPALTHATAGGRQVHQSGELRSTSELINGPPAPAPEQARHQALHGCSSRR